MARTATVFSPTCSNSDWSGSGRHSGNRSAWSSRASSGLTAMAASQKCRIICIPPA
jgi:hypothetical protein